MHERHILHDNAPTHIDYGADILQDNAPRNVDNGADISHDNAPTDFDYGADISHDNAPRDFDYGADASHDVAPRNHRQETNNRPDGAQGANNGAHNNGDMHADHTGDSERRRGPGRPRKRASSADLSLIPT